MMLLVEPQFRVHDGHIDLSMNRPEEWAYPEGMGVANGTYAHIGDATCGPVMFFFAVQPGIDLPESPAHGHASDNWRMSMRGVLPMGRERYGPGDFRFQQGWKPYGSDSMSTGPHGGWAALVFGDRRGTKIRPVREEEGYFPDETSICEWAHLAGDQASDDPRAGSGPAGLVTSAGEISGARVNGSFAAAGLWPEVGDGIRAIGALMGDAGCGPVMVHADVAPGCLASPAGVLQTEVIRLVVAGSCTVGSETYEAGDIRIQDSGARCEAVAAGAEGLHEVVLYGDRRALADHGGALIVGVAALVADLQARLDVDKQLLGR